MPTKLAPRQGAGHLTRRKAMPDIGKIPGAVRACAALAILVGACQAHPPRASAAHERLEPGLQGKSMPGEIGILAQPYAHGVIAVRTGRALSLIIDAEPQAVAELEIAPDPDEQ